MKLPLARIAAVGLVALATGGCRTAPARRPASAVATPPVALNVWVDVDQHFEGRFGPLDGRGRERLNQWLYLAGRQLGLAYPERPMAVKLVGVGRWALRDGPSDLTATFRGQAPAGPPRGSGANCLVAVASRPDVRWGGMASWPRLLVKAQVHEPTDLYTTGLLCHEMSHWFDALDVRDESVPERSVMNYFDRTDGWVDGRLVWDADNRRRMRASLARWPS